MVIHVAFTIKAEEILHIKRFSSLYMFARKKPKIDWKSLEGVFKKPNCIWCKGNDGLEHCPVTGCEHPGFASQRGCRKHVKYIFMLGIFISTLNPPYALRLLQSLKQRKVSSKFLAVLHTMILHALFRSGFKAAAVVENLANNQIIQSQEL